ncbi:hypothetical protein [Nocardioides sp. GXZ039]|uniref:hypothetical protein n=1 Tax=Nocardioides sp. GXZ039 TaxID=3136018 RepID=UPI0030F38CF6
MSDFEDLLTRALTEGAEDAPSAAGLAAAARERRSRRTRRRAAVGAAAAVLAVVVPTAVVAVWPDSERPDPVNQASASPPTTGVDGWHTIESSGVAVDVPAGWGATEPLGNCGFRPWPLFAPVDEDPCQPEHRLMILESHDPADDVYRVEGASGEIAVGRTTIQVTAPDHDTARRILASARPVGEPAPALDTWETFDIEGTNLVADVPRNAGIRIDVAPGFVDCVVPLSQPARVEGGRWQSGYCDGRAVSVTAPTRALAYVVAASIR